MSNHFGVLSISAAQVIVPRGLAFFFAEPFDVLNGLTT
jgi:hypothetical protein